MPVYPKSLCSSFHTTDLVDQFILTEDAALVPQGWTKDARGPWRLGTHPSLPVTRIRAEADRIDGWLLGVALDPSRRTFVFGSAGPSRVPSFQDFAAFETWIGDATGRYVAVLFRGSESRVYLDPAGSQAAVYAPERRIVAASPMLIPYDSGTDDDVGLIDAFGIPERRGMFAFGMTPRRGVARLLPNHYLDLATFRTARHWPTADPAETEALAVAGTVAETLEGTIETVCASCEPYLSITAGVDSRTLLGCARKHTDRIRFFTWELPDDKARADVMIAKRLAREHRLRHEVFRFRPANDVERDEWLYRTGCSVGEKRGLSLASTVKQMRRDTWYMPGLASELGRLTHRVPSAFPDDPSRSHLAPEDLLRRLNLPQLPSIVGAASAWLAALPVSRVSHMLDLAHLEQRMGCWAAPTAYAEAKGPFRVLPFANRRLFDLIMGLPDAYRMEQRLALDVISLAWPELLDAPINPPVRHLPARARAVLARTPFLWRLGKYL